MATNLRFRKHQTRDAVLAQMVADLLRYAAYGDERAATRTLSCLGYAVGDIVDLADAAMALATLEAVRIAMVES